MSEPVKLTVVNNRIDAQPRPDAQFYCTRCDGDQFRVYTLGRIECVKCRAHMRNIFVTRDS